MNKDQNQRKLEISREKEIDGEREGGGSSECNGKAKGKLVEQHERGKK